MKNEKFKKILSYSLPAAFIFFASCSVEKSKKATITAEDYTYETWAVGGYLPENPTKKVFVVFEKNDIKEIVDAAPTDVEKVIDSENWIMPGLIDLHNHLVYDVLPLWENGQGQWDHRYEWRDKDLTHITRYKEATTTNLSYFKQNVKAHASVARWAEVKALVGGTTLIQGASGETKFVNSFLVPNVEEQTDIPGLPKVEAIMDVVENQVAYGALDNVIYPEQQRIAVAEGRRIEDVSFDALADAYYVNSGLSDWISEFKEAPRSVEAALRLTLGSDIQFDWLEEATGVFPNYLPRTAFDENAQVENAKFAEIGTYLETVKRFRFQNPAAKKAAIVAILDWIYGEKSIEGSFLKSKTDQSSAANFLYRTGVARINKDARAFYLDFYSSSFPRMKKAASSPGDKSKRVIIHMAEGSTQHHFTRREFKDLVRTGLDSENLIIIHGMGVDASDITRAKEKNMSFVWSPLSNLLLYKETLDVPELLKKGVNVSLGPDWSLSGSKSLLYELKAAKRVIDQWIEQNKIPAFSAKQIVELATVNPAKALGVEERLGLVAPGAYANVILVRKQSANAYEDLLQSTENDLNLVVVGGVARSGASDLMKKFSANPDSLEKLADYSANKCVTDKLVDLNDASPDDEALVGRERQRVPLTNLKVIADLLKTTKEKQFEDAKAAAEKIRRGEETNDIEKARAASLPYLTNVDSLFDCDSPAARKEMNDVTKLVSQRPETLAEQRQRLRQEKGLAPRWKAN